MDVIQRLHDYHKHVPIVPSHLQCVHKTTDFLATYTTAWRPCVVSNLDESPYTEQLVSRPKLVWYQYTLPVSDVYNSLRTVKYRVAYLPSPSN